MDDIPKQMPDSPTRLIDQIRAKIRSRNLTYATERTYVHWILRFIRFNGKRHPMNMGGKEVELFEEMMRKEESILDNFGLPYTKEYLEIFDTLNYQSDIKNVIKKLELCAINYLISSPEIEVELYDFASSTKKKLRMAAPGLWTNNVKPSIETVITFLVTELV